MSKGGTTAQNDLELLLAMLNHEVRTPLSALVGFVELLHPDMSPGELNDGVQRIKSSARALSEVIDTLQDLPKLELGEPKFEETPFELRDLIEDLVGSFETQVDRSRLELTVDLDSRIPPVLQGARARVRQVLGNLVSNALKFTERGQVCIRFERISATDDVVRLRYSVVDTGRGIPTDLHRRIFEPFVRAEEAPNSTTTGSGLGLSICVALLDAMGSNIELESRVGKGSTFSFELIHEVPPDVRSELSEPGREINGENAEETRILIVDDDQDNLEVLGRLVRREGFAVDLVHDGCAALSMIDRRDYAMLLTDLRMSRMDGLELSRRLRERAARMRQPVMPIIAITADSLLKGETGRAVQDSFDAILLKPVRPRVLARLLEPYKAARSGQWGSGDALPQTPVDTSVISLVPGYLDRRSEDLSLLRKFLTGEASIETVATIGHNLKGTAHSYGFSRLGELGAALEEAANANQVQRIASLVDRFEHWIGEARRTGESRSEMKRPASGRTGRVPIRHR